MSDYEDIVESLVEVELPDSDAFLKVKETVSYTHLRAHETS